jgi:hypothetical protein
VRPKLALGALAAVAMLLSGPAYAQRGSDTPPRSGEYLSAQARPGFQRPSGGGPPGPPPASAQPAPSRSTPGFNFAPAPGGRPPSHDHGHSSVVVGGAYWWGWPYPYWDYPYYPPYPYYPYYPYPPYYPYYPSYRYSAPAVTEPPVYVEQARPGYWYYCASAREYYPKAAKCPQPWIPVAPRPGGG